MKTKNKLLTAIVLCTLFLVALPGIGIATAQEDDYVLDIYGNANEDDTIDMRDITFTARITLWLEDETTLADANYDGDVNVLDMTQIGLIILGQESELTIIDSEDRTVTVSLPIERSVIFYTGIVETMRSIKASDTIVGLDTYTIGNELFPEFSDYPGIGSPWSPDYEAVLALEPDAVFVGTASWEAITVKMEELGITAICIDIFGPAKCIDGTKKLGYIFNKREEAEEYIDFYESIMNTIEESVSDIPEEERTKVYYEQPVSWFGEGYHTFGVGTGWDEVLTTAGGNNIFGDGSGYFTVTAEAVMDLDPEIMIVFDYDPESCYFTDDVSFLKGLRDEIMGRPELVAEPAIVSGNVFAYDDSNFGGAQHFILIAYQAKWFYPELFDTLQPNEYLQEYLTRFQGLDIDVMNHGAYVYHPVYHPDGR